MHICVTHVDNLTKIPGNIAPMQNGPTFPDVKGLNIVWWDQSNWPLTHPDQFPRFYGTCDDDADTDIPGVVFVYTDREHTADDGTVTTVTAQSQYEAALADEEKARLPKYATPIQIRLALLEMGLAEEVNAHFDTYTGDVKAKIDIIWSYATRIHRYHPIVNKMGEALGYSEDKLDEIFIKANEVSDNPFPEEVVE